MVHELRIVLTILNCILNFLFLIYIPYTEFITEPHLFIYLLDIVYVYALQQQNGVIATETIQTTNIDSLAL